MSEQNSPSSASESFGSPVADKVFDLLAPVVATVDAEIVDVEWAGGTLRLIIDSEGGISTDALAQANRLVSPILDQHDPIPGRYTLEVSSPGVERPLRRRSHYQRAVGEHVIVKQIPGLEPRRLRGVLESFTDETLSVKVVEVDGVDLSTAENFEINIADVDTARTQFHWGPTPKKQGGGKRQKKSKKSQASKPKNQKQKRSEDGT